MDRTFSPCALSGVAAVPPSKSEAHRRMICAALTPGETRLTGFLPSRDMTATMDCLSALGASFHVEGETLLVRGCGGPAAFAPRMDCGESGSTLRFLIPLALALGEGGGFLMGGRLGERPLEPYDPILEACGVTSRRESTPQGVLLTLRGRLRPGNYTLPGDVSSQFVTGMLYALPLLPGDSTLTVTPPVESAGYIRMTLQCLADSGIRLEETGPYAWRIPGNQRYRATGGALPGDWSQGAVLLCAGALGHPVNVAGLDLASTQGDRAALDVLARLGVSFREEGGVLRPLGGTLRGAAFSGRDIPDIVPVLALACTQAAGESRITGCGRLRLKESDRFAATVELLSALGADLHGEGDDLVVRGPTPLKGGVTLSARNDHRLVMLLALAATVADGPLTVQGVEALNKSWPTFLTTYEALGGKVS